MNDSWVKPIEEENDFEVFISKDFKFMYYLVSRNKIEKYYINLLKVCRLYVRPYSEYFEFWASMNTKNIDI